MTTERKPDRRVERTFNALRDALMALIAEKGYDAITIQDIVDRANVARATFYLHFKDKDELMFRAMRVIYDDITARLARQMPWHEWDDDSDFQHVAQYADFYSAMLSAKGSMGFLAQVRAYLAAEIERAMREALRPDHRPRIPLPVVAAYCAGAQVGLLWWWVENRMPFPADVMSRYAVQLSVMGFIWGIGAESLVLAQPDLPDWLRQKA